MLRARFRKTFCESRFREQKNRPFWVGGFLKMMIDCMCIAGENSTNGWGDED